jgi:hypothetical protein
MSTNPLSQGKFSELQKGAVIIEIVVALGIYSLALSMIYEAITIISRSITVSSNAQKSIEDFEDVLVYLNKEVRNNDFELIEKNGWSVLLIDPASDKATSAIAYRLLSTATDYSLTRLRSIGPIDIHATDLKSYGKYHFSSSKYFSGFNSLYHGKNKISFSMEGKYLVFTFDKIKTYLGIKRTK